MSARPLAILACLLASCGDQPEVLIVRNCPTCPPAATVGAACLGDNDGAIDASELPFVSGTRIAYLANDAAPVTVDPVGETIAGEWTWNFQEGPTAIAGVVEIMSATGAWWSDDVFPSATHATPASLSAPDVLAVFRAEQSRLLLLGLISASESPPAGLTRLVYDEPVVLYDFPLTAGKQWAQDVTFSDARLAGAANAGTDRYRFVIDGQGTALLPSFAFQNTLRLRIELTRTLTVSVGQNTGTLVQLSYLHECVGEVARVVSQPGETDVNFTQASEVRRLGLPGKGGR